MCVSWKTPCIARFFFHAVPLIDAEAIMLSSQGFAPESAAGPVASSTGRATATPASLVGRTVADVERDLIIDTLSHCLGNRTHAANILGISIRTLRNKLKQYSDSGVPVQPGSDEERAVS